MRPEERVPLGHTDLTVTRLGLGTGPLGGLFAPVTDSDAYATLDRAYALGLRLFDTAPLYGYGVAEQYLKCVLQSRPRDEFVLATKVGRLLRGDAPPGRSLHHDDERMFKGVPVLNPVFDFSYEGTLRSFDESLLRLSLDRIDILHIHDPDKHINEAAAGAYRALRRLRQEGVISAIGVAPTVLTYCCSLRDAPTSTAS